MKNLTTLKTALVLAALMALPVAHAATMTKADYDAAIHKCEPMTGDDKALCTEAAKQQWKIDSAKHGKPMMAARHRGAGYDMEVHKCDAMTGDDKTACTEAAKLKYPLPPTAAEQSPAYQAELKKCEAVPVGDDRTLCTEAAKNKLGKM